MQGQDGDENQDLKSLDREVKFEDWRFNEISRGYHLKELKKLMSIDPVLKTIKPKLTGVLRGMISAHKPTINVLEALRSLINLLTEAGFTAGTFNAQTLLECSQDRVIAAGQSLSKTLGALIGIRGPGDNLTPPIGATNRQITTRITMNQVIIPINDSTKDEHTGSFRYALAEPEDDSNYSFEIQRMSLEPRDADLLRKKLELNEAEDRSGKPPATQLMNMVESDQMNSYPKQL